MNKVTVLLCKVNKAAEVVEIENNMEGVAAVLGTDRLAEIKPWSRDVVVVFSDQQGGKENRLLYGEDGAPLLTVRGDFVVALLPPNCEAFLPMPPMYVDRYGRYMEVL